MKTILIDDEPGSLESLTMEIGLYCPEVEIIGRYSNPAMGLAAIKSLKPDLVMLDIEMPQLDGFKLLQSLEVIDFDLIFITAYDEYAVRAFEFNAIDYLLKPILKKKLVSAIQKVKDNKSKKMDMMQLKALLNNLNIQTGLKMENVALPISNGYVFVNVNDILYAKSESNYTTVCMIDDNKYFLSKTLKEFVKMIDCHCFFRVHHSYFVNMNHVFKYIRGQGGHLVLKNNEQIPVSRSKKEALINRLRRR